MSVFAKVAFLFNSLPVPFPISSTIRLAIFGAASLAISLTAVLAASRSDQTHMVSPTATYRAPDGTHKEFTVGSGPHSTSGNSTKISDVVIRAGGEDRDKPTEANDTPLGHLRAELTTLQDQVNEFLTQRMKGDDGDMERRVLDGGDEDDDDDV